MCQQMLWKTHLRISFEALRKLGITLTNEVNQSFRNGILAPDQWKDFPHHHGKSNDIRNHLMKSRGYFLQDNLPKAYFHLGVALHYIQDSYTSVVSYRGPKRQIWHQNWEERIENSYFVSNLEKTITYSLRNKQSERDRCLRLAHILSKGAIGRDNTLYVATLSGHQASENSAKPIVDLNLGLKASYVVTKSVLSAKNCPALEAKLKNNLTNHEGLMINAEIELSNKIIRLINERDDLKRQKVTQSGIVSKIKNWILGIRIRLKDFSANSNYKSYIQRKHLKKVAKQYAKTANRTVAPYAGWYSFKIPRINLNVVSRELFSCQEAAEILGEKENILKQLLTNLNVSTFHVKNWELITRAELDSFLFQHPVNGFNKFPS